VVGWRRVDGVLICDLRVGDARIEVLEKLQLPAVVIGGVPSTGGLGNDWSDDAIHGTVHRGLGRFASYKRSLA